MILQYELRRYQKKFISGLRGLIDFVRVQIPVREFFLLFIRKDVEFRDSKTRL